MEALITVIVPVYKTERYLDQCVQSIVNQTYPNLEIILVDDGSPDGCPQICDDWAAKDQRIRVIHKANGGSAQARNRGIAAATGEYISFIDSDDYISPLFFERLYHALDEINGDIAECEYTTFFEASPFTETESEDSCTPQTFDSKSMMKEHIEGNSFQQIVWNKLYRAAVVQPFTEGKLIDDEFWTYRILARSNAAVRIPLALYYYRQQPESVMHRAYALERLQALEAKQEEILLLKEYYPELVLTAQRKLLFSCLFHGQMVLKYLKGDNLGRGIEILKESFASVEQTDLNGMEGKQKVWAVMAKCNLLLTCRLRNLFRIGF